MYLQSVNEQMWGGKTNKRSKTRKRSPLISFQSVNALIKIQLQSCRLSLLPPMHSSDSDQRAHT